MRHLGIAAFFVGAIVLSVAVAYSAPGPSPSRDLDPLFSGNRPGCDFVDYSFEVCNTSETFDYVVKMAGTVGLSGGGPETCCGGSACANSFKNDEQIILAGACQVGTVMSYPQFPACDPNSCDCDNDACDEDSWCAVISDPAVLVTQWKFTDEETWTVYESPVVLCEGTGAGKSCPTESACD